MPAEAVLKAVDENVTTGCTFYEGETCDPLTCKDDAFGIKCYDTRSAGSKPES